MRGLGVLVCVVKFVHTCRKGVEPSPSRKGTLTMLSATPVSSSKPVPSVVVVLYYARSLNH